MPQRNLRPEHEAVMSKSFLNFISGFATARELESACWRPAADVYQTSDGWLIKLDLAGVNPREIQLQFDGGGMRVSGMRRDAVVREDCCSYSLEINYNRFERRIELPCDAGSCRVTTEYRDGMLLVWLTASK
jgi:HSP20 family protein